MKNQYFGDINDFHKYTILSALSSHTRMPVCFIWMLTENDPSGDGEKRGHFEPDSNTSSLNPNLFAFLKQHDALRDQRTVAVMKNAPGFQNAMFVDARLARECNQHPAYFTVADQIIRPNDLLFFDPDNGLEVKSVPRTRSAAVKYLYWEDLIPRYRRGHSAVIYQHIPREKHVVYTRRKLRDLEAKLKHSTAFSIRTKRVLFLVAAQPAHKARLHAALRRYFLPDAELHNPNAFEFHDRLLRPLPTD